MKELSMEEKIFASTQSLMAEVGLQGLSMQKIAKRAGISAGTIYLHFTNKEALLQELALRIFKLFQRTLWTDFDESRPIFQQYQTMWWNIWLLLQENPELIINMNQYHALPGLDRLCKESEEKGGGPWYSFCERAIQAGEIVNLPPNLLWNLSLETAINVALDCAFMQSKLTDDQLDMVIKRSFYAIKANL